MCFVNRNTTAIKIGLIIIFIIAGFSIANPQQINVLPISGDYSLIFSSGFAVSLVWVSYAYTGWNSTVYISGEVKNPQKNIHKSLLISTSFVMILYVLLNFIFLYSTPMSEMIGEVEVGYISGVKIFGSTGAKIIGISVENNEAYDYWIKIPKVDNILYPLIELIPLQLLAYYTAIRRKNNPDYPRNLAKSVTVK